MTKADVLAAVRNLLTVKKEDLQGMLSDLQSGLANDTKSSAGDKYETSREMSQQELEKISVQLAEVNRQLALLHPLETTAKSTAVLSGAFVNTSGGDFLIGVPVGAVHVNGVTVYCISATAPMAQALLHKKEGESFQFNGNTLLVKSIL